MRYTYTDVTNHPDVVAPYPEVVTAFGELGWVRLGRVAFELEPRRLEGVLKGYAAQDRSTFEAHLPDVATALASPDRTALADVSWFWDSPSVRLATLTADGQLVETVREWDHRPAWPRNLARARRGMVVAEEIRRSHVPGRGRSIRVVHDGDPAGVRGVEWLWHEHVRHVREVAGIGLDATTSATTFTSTSASTFTTVEDAIALRHKAYAHDLRVSARVMWAHFAVLLVAACLAGGVFGLVAPSTLPPLGEALVIAVVLLVGWWASPYVWRWLGYERRLRPRFG